MEQKAQIALEASIAHWEANCIAMTPDEVRIRTADCALFIKFAVDRCHGCPVSEVSHTIDCDGTPFREVYIALHTWIMRYHEQQTSSTKQNSELERWANKEFNYAARKQLAFLKSLRPEVLK